MRNIPTICAMALALAACGGKDKAADAPSNKTEYVDVVDETVPADNGADVILPAAGSTSAPVAETPERRATVEAIKSVPQDKRRQLAALLECEEDKVPGGVAVMERPAFVQKTLAKLDADPMAVAHCRQGANPETPTQ